MAATARLLLTLSLAASSLFSQQDAPIRVDVRQVLVPVIAADKKGHHVTGLHATDFRIFEDGVPQEIASFSSDTAALASDPATLSSAPASQGGPRRTFVICIDALHASPADAPRIRAMLESLFEKEKMGDAQYVLIGIGRQLQVLQSATTNPLAILQKVRTPAFEAMLGGRDASAFAAQLNNLRIRMEDLCKRCACSVGRSSQSSCDGQLDTLKQSVDADVERWTAPTNALLDQFKSVVEELAKLPTGRTLILVSDGFSVNPIRDFYAVVAAYLPGRPQFRLNDESDALAAGAVREALKVAADRNVTIDSIDIHGGAAPALANLGAMDAGASGSPASPQTVLGTSGPRGVGAPSVRQSTLQASAGPRPNPFASEDSLSMEELARSTGGVYFHDPINPLKGLRNALADGREYYVLAYVSTNGAHDGKFRRITVETTNKSLVLRAKPGYWADDSAQ